MYNMTRSGEDTRSCRLNYQATKVARLVCGTLQIWLRVRASVLERGVPRIQN
jgi:hypothetical protein